MAERTGFNSISFTSTGHQTDEKEECLAYIEQLRKKLNEIRNEVNSEECRTYLNTLDQLQKALLRKRSSELVKKVAIGLRDLNSKIPQLAPAGLSIDSTAVCVDLTSDHDSHLFERRSGSYNKGGNQTTANPGFRNRLTVREPECYDIDSDRSPSEMRRYSESLFSRRNDRIETHQIDSSPDRVSTIIQTAKNNIRETADVTGYTRKNESSHFNSINIPHEEQLLRSAIENANQMNLGATSEQIDEYESRFHIALFESDGRSRHTEVNGCFKSASDRPKEDTERLSTLLQKAMDIRDDNEEISNPTNQQMNDKKLKGAREKLSQDIQVIHKVGESGKIKASLKQLKTYTKASVSPETQSAEILPSDGNREEPRVDGSSSMVVSPREDERRSRSPKSRHFTESSGIRRPFDRYHSNNRASSRSISPLSSHSMSPLSRDGIRERRPSYGASSHFNSRNKSRFDYDRNDQRYSADRRDTRKDDVGVSRPYSKNRRFDKRRGGPHSGYRDKYKIDRRDRSAVQPRQPITAQSVSVRHQSASGSSKECKNPEVFNEFINKIGSGIDKVKDFENPEERIIDRVTDEAANPPLGKLFRKSNKLKIDTNLSNVIKKIEKTSDERCTDENRETTEVREEGEISPSEACESPSNNRGTDTAEHLISSSRYPTLLKSPIACDSTESSNVSWPTERPSNTPKINWKSVRSIESTDFARPITSSVASQMGRGSTFSTCQIPGRPNEVTNTRVASSFGASTVAPKDPRIIKSNHFDKRSADPRIGKGDSRMGKDPRMKFNERPGMGKDLRMKFNERPAKEDARLDSTSRPVVPSKSNIDVTNNIPSPASNVNVTETSSRNEQDYRARRGSNSIRDGPSDRSKKPQNFKSNPKSVVKNFKYQSNRSPKKVDESIENIEEQVKSSSEYRSPLELVSCQSIRAQTGKGYGDQKSKRSHSSLSSFRIPKLTKQSTGQQSHPEISFDNKPIKKNTHDTNQAPATSSTSTLNEDNWDAVLDDDVNESATLSRSDLDTSKVPEERLQSATSSEPQSVVTNASNSGYDEECWDPVDDDLICVLETNQSNSEIIDITESNNDRGTVTNDENVAQRRETDGNKIVVVDDSDEENRESITRTEENGSNEALPSLRVNDVFSMSEANENNGIGISTGLSVDIADFQIVHNKYQSDAGDVSATTVISDDSIGPSKKKRKRGKSNDVEASNSGKKKPECSNGKHSDDTPKRNDSQSNKTVINLMLEHLKSLPSFSSIYSIIQRDEHISAADFLPQIITEIPVEQFTTLQKILKEHQPSSNQKEGKTKESAVRVEEPVDTVDTPKGKKREAKWTKKAEIQASSTKKIIGKRHTTELDRLHADIEKMNHTVKNNIFDIGQKRSCRSRPPNYDERYMNPSRSKSAAVKKQEDNVNSGNDSDTSTVASKRCKTVAAVDSESDNSKSSVGPSKKRFRSKAIVSDDSDPDESSVSTREQRKTRDEIFKFKPCPRRVKLEHFGAKYEDFEVSVLGKKSQTGDVFSKPEAFVVLPSLPATCNDLVTCICRKKTRTNDGVVDQSDAAVTKPKPKRVRKFTSKKKRGKINAKSKTCESISQDLDQEIKDVASCADSAEKSKSTGVDEEIANESTSSINESMKEQPIDDSVNDETNEELEEFPHYSGFKDPNITSLEIGSIGVRVNESNLLAYVCKEGWCKYETADVRMFFLHLNFLHQVKCTKVCQLCPEIESYPSLKAAFRHILQNHLIAEDRKIVHTVTVKAEPREDVDEPSDEGFVLGGVQEPANTMGITQESVPTVHSLLSSPAYSLSSTPEPISENFSPSVIPVTSELSSKVSVPSAIPVTVEPSVRPVTMEPSAMPVTMEPSAIPVTEQSSELPTPLVTDVAESSENLIPSVIPVATEQPLQYPTPSITPVTDSALSNSPKIRVRRLSGDHLSGRLEEISNIIAEVTPVEQRSAEIADVSVEPVPAVESQLETNDSSNLLDDLNAIVKNFSSVELYRLNLYKCSAPECNFSTDEKNVFFNHIFSAHKSSSKRARKVEPSSLMCVYCKEKFDTPEMLLIHLDRYKNCTFQCAYCSYRTARPVVVTWHQKNAHQNEQIRILVKNIEDNKEVISESSSLEEKDPREIATPLICVHCNEYETISFEEFIDHWKQNHSLTNVWKCQSCDGTFFTCDRYVKHMILHGCGEYQCVYCRTGALNEDVLKTHFCNKHCTLYPKAMKRVKAKESGLSFRFENSIEELDLDVPLAELINHIHVPTAVTLHKVDEDASTTEAPSATGIYMLNDDMKYVLDVAATKQYREQQRTSKVADKRPIQPDATEVNDFISIESSDEDSNRLMICEEAPITEAPPPKVAKSTFTTGLSEVELYKCGFVGCDSVFEDYHSFKEHLQTCDNARNRTPLKCPHCKRQFQTNAKFLAHIGLHGVARFKCSLCDAKFTTSKKSEDHMRQSHKIAQCRVIPANPLKDNVHKDVYIAIADPDKGVKNNKQCKKPIDTKILASIAKPKDAEMAKHITTVYSYEEVEKHLTTALFPEPVTCGICSIYSSKVRTNIIAHLKCHSTGLVPVKDITNPVPCIDKNELMFNKMTNHAAFGAKTDDKRIKCLVEKVEAGCTNKDEMIPGFVAKTLRFSCSAPGCVYVSTDAARLKTHWETLHAELTYNCPHCGVNIPCEKIPTHLRYHDGRLFKCYYCTKLHYQRSGIEKHQAECHVGSESTVQVIRELSAEECDELSRDARNQYQNLERGIGKIMKPSCWKCNLCRYHVVTSEDTVRSHCLSAHRVDKRFKCCLCTFADDDRNVVNEHMTENHENVSQVIITVYKQFNEDETQLNLSGLTKNTKPERRYVEECKPDEQNDVQNDIPADAETNELFIMPLSNNRYRCPHCLNYFTSNRQLMKEHIYREKNYLKFVCHQCGECYTTDQEIRKHARSVHNDENVVGKLSEDEVYEKQVEQILNYQQMKFNQVQATELISLASSDDDEVVLEELISSFESMVPVPSADTNKDEHRCVDCNKVCLTLRGLKNHYTTVHLRKNPVTSTPSNVSRKRKISTPISTSVPGVPKLTKISPVSITTVQNVEGVYPCPFCNEKFQSTETVAKHLCRCYGSDEKSNTVDEKLSTNVNDVSYFCLCSICGTRLSKTDMNSHMSKCRAKNRLKQKVVCVKCKLELDAGSLERHVKTKHEPMECLNCNKVLYGSENLEHHVRLSIINVNKVAEDCVPVDKEVVFVCPCCPTGSRGNTYDQYMYISDHLQRKHELSNKTKPIVVKMNNSRRELLETEVALLQMKMNNEEILSATMPTISTKVAPPVVKKKRNVAVKSTSRPTPASDSRLSNANSVTTIPKPKFNILYGRKSDFF